MRDDILGGALPPGERLIEVALSERYAVGRAAIRAALVELDAEGLVIREANRGAAVRRISLADAIEITEARAALEGLLARRAAENADVIERDELRALGDRMSAAVANAELVEYGKLNRVLHRRLSDIAAHDVAHELVANLRNRAAHHQFRLATVEGRANESLPQHLAVIDAVVTGDGPGAETAMRAHLDSVVSVLRHWSELGVPV